MIFPSSYNIYVKEASLEFHSEFTHVDTEP